MLFIREGAVVDPAELATYSAANRSNAGTFVEKYKLRPLSVYGAIEAFEGDAPDGVVLLEFPTADDARAWYHSPEYQAAIPHREKGAPYRALLIEGL
jgi:uncharacterized protein (DUF1330 family)